MKLVLFSLRRPVSVLVAIIAVILASTAALRQMSFDIFPDLGEPVIYIAQPYGGLDPAQMDGFATYYYEYHLLYVAGVKQIESKSVQGAALIKITFQSGVNMSTAMSEVVGYANRARAFMPPGAVPPFITRFDAGSVAIAQLVFSSQTRTTAEMQDFAINRVRPLFATIPGVSAPPPFGGSQRTIVVRLDPDKLREYRVSPEDAIRAVANANVVAPSGVVRTGDLTRIASTNATIGAELGDLAGTPVRASAGTPVYLRDLGVVENGSDILTAYAHVNGKRTVYIPVTKRADASTLSVIARVRDALPLFQKAVPEDVDVRIEFDQSGFVSAALNNLLREGLLGAVLSGLMVLLFLRDWRSSLIVLITIPVSLLASVACLAAFGQTINLMTLAGLALAVGILVDESTVEVENIHAELDRGTAPDEAVRLATTRTAIPRLLSLVAILSVFVPAFFMGGIARQLLLPLSLAVGFAMIASYLISSSLVPVLARAWMRPSRHAATSALGTSYAGFLTGLIRLRWLAVPLYLAACLAVCYFAPQRLGLEIFPRSGAKQIRLRMFAPTGTRIERTEPLALRTLDLIQETIGRDRCLITTSFVGMHASSYPVSLIHLFTTGPQEAVLTIGLKPGPPLDEENLREKIRARLRQDLPQVTILFEPGDIVNQILNFGAATPVQVAIVGPALAADLDFARKVEVELKKLPFLRDLMIQQSPGYPTLEIAVNRDRAGQYNLTTQDVTRSLVTATSSSRFIEPNYWRDPVSGNAFQVQVEIPQNRVQSEADLAALPVNKPGQTQPLLGDIATFKQGTMFGLVERFNGQKLVSLAANLNGLTIGEAQAPLEAAIARAGTPPRGISVQLRGQLPPLKETLLGVKTGLVLASISIFLLLAGFFQSFRLGFAVLLVSPAIAAGSLVALSLAGATLNLQSFLGILMSLGIATANAILYLSFASADGDAVGAASARARAILMTAFAMLAGMVPMALGWGEGAEQTAPLAIAVLGGVAAGSLTTLLILPAIFVILKPEKSQ